MTQIEQLKNRVIQACELNGIRMLDDANETVLGANSTHQSVRVDFRSHFMDLMRHQRIFTQLESIADEFNAPMNYDIDRNRIEFYIFTAKDHS